jgi:hypothetical protein
MSAFAARGLPATKEHFCTECKDMFREAGSVSVFYSVYSVASGPLSHRRKAVIGPTAGA